MGHTPVRRIMGHTPVKPPDMGPKSTTNLPNKVPDWNLAHC